MKATRPCARRVREENAETWRGGQGDGVTGTEPGAVPRRRLLAAMSGESQGARGIPNGDEVAGG